MRLLGKGRDRVRRFRPEKAIVAVIAAALVALGGAVVLSHPASALTCTVTANPGDNLATKITAAGTNGVLCLNDGAYTTSTELVPLSGQTIQGRWIGGVPKATITASSSRAFNGLSNGATGVTIQQLAVVGPGASSDRGIWAGTGWTIYRVNISAFQFDIAAYGDNIAIRYSQVTAADHTGIIASDHTGLTIDHTKISGANPNCTYDGDYDAGGMKVSNEATVSITTNMVQANHGMGIWLDESVNGATVTGNTSSGQLVDCGGGQGIRYEISCNGTITSNTATNNAGGNIDIANSFGVTANSNTTSGSAAFEMRFLADRDGNYGSACGGGSYYAAGTADSNHITRGTGWVAGVQVVGSHTNTATFTGTTYVTAGQCSTTTNWKVGTGSTNFAGWQAAGQDASGMCS